MYKITKKDLILVAEEKDWCINSHINDIYNFFRFKSGRAPKLIVRSGDNKPAIQQALIDWKADLGARDRINWKGFIKQHRQILKHLVGIKPMGRLREIDIETICSVVRKLEVFKQTIGKRLVFGSKSAHFHFPGFVPVMSSEVEDGLKVIQKKYSKKLFNILRPIGHKESYFDFSSVQNRQQSYKNYIRLGNYIMKKATPKNIFGIRLPKYSLNAKIFEWSVVRHSI